MDNYKCTICGYMYKPERGDYINEIPPGVAFEDLPEDYKCPMCGQPKVVFQKM
ncbi:MULTISPECIES: rubredoxin [unclassified Fusibacter]|uniref:rubredoxin n=1 Tax=unclassified Fusibacter TaxID=2624464 RepID=UPI001010FA24|nr:MULTISPECIES: rubredoxin [unclassified Fusibacter]MCK8059927.1 rubredoxin [Fusibacter sp. A2]NPE22069.1 rubredoxin [Fusibacter sp. A1]RXV60848.1 rubredoxin [Fusibacter sp. A1]